MEKLEKQKCPFCGKNTLTLIEDEKDIPYFDRVYLFSMKCDSCKYLKSDVESVENKEGSKWVIEVDSAKDMEIRVVKSSNAIVKIPQMRLNVRPGPASIGYISNIEGVLNRFKDVLDGQLEGAEDKADRKKIKNLLKKLWKVKLGEVKLKIVIEDVSGNSAILSEKAKMEKI